MKRILRTAFTTIMGLAALQMSAGVEAVKAAFLNMPEQLAPLLSTNGKLDMIDYFESGLDTPTANVVDGRMRITELTPDIMSVSLGEAMVMDICLLATASDTVAMYVSTYATPAPDSQITILSADGTDVTDRLFKAPELKQWLTPQGRKHRKEVEQMLTYMTVAYSYDPATRTLTAKMDYPGTLAVEVRDKLMPLLHSKLVYTWNGKKFLLGK